MRAAIIADIHANADALTAVLDDVTAHEVDEVWCLGDLVGYGPDAEEVVRVVRDRCAFVIGGNHELVLTNRARVAWSGPLGASIEFAGDVIDAEAYEWLRALPMQSARAGCAVVHASPRNPAWEFISSARVAAACFRHLPAITLFGHTHEPRAYARTAQGAIGIHKPELEARLRIDDVSQALLNPGAVGRPQLDGDLRASWMLLDLEENLATWFRVAFDWAPVAERMRALGFAELAPPPYG